MNHIILSSLAFVGGICLALQGSLNSQLGVLLKNPLMASLTAYSVSTLITVIAITVGVKQLPNVSDLKEIPWHLWFSGALFSFCGISLYYYTIPLLGVSKMISFGLCGQLICAVIASHYGWFSLPIEPISIRRCIGLFSMLSGIYLINFK